MECTFAPPEMFAEHEGTVREAVPFTAQLGSPWKKGALHLFTRSQIQRRASKLCDFDCSLFMMSHTQGKFTAQIGCHRERKLSVNNLSCFD